MLTLKIIFWASLALAFYTYLGYGMVLAVWLRLRRLWQKPTPAPPDPAEAAWPAATLLIAVYNEADILDEKMRNCLALDYPAGKLKLMFVTDGSTDGSDEVLRRYSEAIVLHENARRGKIAAIDRAMTVVDTPITVLTDANTYLNPQAIRELVRPLLRPEVGAVAGEKYIRTRPGAAASEAGEGLYWRYESLLKKMDAQLYSVVGAAGELYAIRTELFQEVPGDTLLDDFMQTLLIAKAGYRVDYRPTARAEEYPSSGLKEELKRKVRICAGGIQSISRLLPLLNPFRYGLLSFQYISHRVLRWTLTPLALPLLLLTNIALAVQGLPLYQVILLLQLAFYGLALMGYFLQGKRVPVPGFFVPLYFCVMNYSVYAGALRYFRGQQSVNWEKAKRVEVAEVS